MFEQGKNISYDFSGQNILITGATGGIGSAIAKMFLEANGTVCLVSTRQEKLDKLLAGEFARFDKNNIYTQVCDFTNQEDVESLVFRATKLMDDKLDILVCNAGITMNGMLIRTKNEDFDKVMQVDLKANFILNREASKVMLKHKYGRIVNISSIVGLVGNVGQASYAAAKAGLIGLTKTVGLEFAKKGITANVVAPGFTQTAMIETIPASIQEALLKDIPMRRNGTVYEIAAAVLFLASKEASYITSTVLNVSGGLVRL
ncbi:MAG: SDR family oxidoreductase [Alphaproteobacteria bacterium]|nr:SDR family oxidoreductase [Rickettsiales bacterium]